MMKIAGSGSISQRHGSADPDPHQNVMDLQHCLYLCGVQAPLKRRRPEAPAWFPASSPRSSQPFMGSRGSRIASPGDELFFAYNFFCKKIFRLFLIGFEISIKFCVVLKPFFKLCEEKVFRSH
jgi:hypothetical protein